MTTGLTFSFVSALAAFIAFNTLPLSVRGKKRKKWSEMPQLKHNTLKPCTFIARI